MPRLPKKFTPPGRTPRGRAAMVAEIRRLARAETDARGRRRIVVALPPVDHAAPIGALPIDAHASPNGEAVAIRQWRLHAERAAEIAVLSAFNDLIDRPGRTAAGAEAADQLRHLAEILSRIEPRDLAIAASESRRSIEPASRLERALQVSHAASAARDAGERLAAFLDETEATGPLPPRADPLIIAFVDAIVQAWVSEHDATPDGSQVGRIGELAWAAWETASLPEDDVDLSVSTAIRGRVERSIYERNRSGASTSFGTAKTADQKK